MIPQPTPCHGHGHGSSFSVPHPHSLGILSNGLTASDPRATSFLVFCCSGFPHGILGSFLLLTHAWPAKSLQPPHPHPIAQGGRAGLLMLGSP